MRHGFAFEFTTCRDGVITDCCHPGIKPKRNVSSDPSQSGIFDMDCRLSYTWRNETHVPQSVRYAVQDHICSLNEAHRLECFSTQFTLR
jgi:hypothetical protein